jgi:signal transduction histidine kinase
MTIAILIWVDFTYLSRRTSDYEIATFYLRLAWAVTPILFVSIYVFILVSLDMVRKRKIVLFGLITLGIITTIVIMQTSLIISGIAYLDGKFAIAYGSGLWPFFGFILILIILSVVSLLPVIMSSYPSEKKRKLQIVFAGMSFFFIINIIYNIIYPVFFHIFSLYEWGDYSTLILLAVVAYASIRHRFFDVPLIMTSTLISFVGCLLLFRGIIFSPSLESAAISFAIFLCYLPVGYFLMRYMNQAREQNKKLSVLTHQLQNQTNQYKQLAKEQEDIIDIIGHEMHSPLTTILQTIHLYKETAMPYKNKTMQTLKKDAILTERIGIVYDSFASIERSSKHALTLVNTMLETARIDSNMIRITQTTFDLTDVTKEIVNSYSLLMAESVHISLQIPQEQCIISADKIKVEQSLHELIRNGIKYGKNAPDDIPHLTITLTKTKTEVHLAVKDNGHGINQSDIPSLGSKFTRLHDDKSNPLRAPGGTGLGLYIVRRYMEKQGGKLVIESDGIGKGSRFILVIPISKQSEA